MITYPSMSELSLSVRPKCAPRPYMVDTDIKCHAWCPELNRMVSATEIWNLLYGEEVLNTELSFYCVDIGCRARLILKNCQPYMSDADAQFRLYPRVRHHHDCAYIVEQVRKKNKLLSHRRTEAMQTYKRPHNCYII